MNLNEKILEMTQNKKKHLREIEKLESEVRETFLLQIRKLDPYEVIYNQSSWFAEKYAKMEMRAKRTEKLLFVHNCILVAGFLYWTLKN